MGKLSGFYPKFKKKYFIKPNPKNGTYSIMYWGSKDILMVHRTGISTRRDAENQLKSLNFR